MENNETHSDELLLYDPLFETPPDTVIRDTPGRGFWGKAPVKKALFVIVLTLFVGSSIVLSFRSLTKDRFRYEETEDGVMLTEFVADKTDTVLEVGPVFDRDGQAVPGKAVTAVRQFAVCGNEYTSVILIGKDVREMPDAAFYNCTSLLAVLVDPANPAFRSVEGVLYRQENGRLTELMLYPARNYLYRALLGLGEKEPADAAQAEAFAARALQLEETSADWLDAQREDYPAQGGPGLTEAESAALLSGLRYGIAPEVTRIGEMAFAECDTLFEVTIPEGVKEVASMAFFKCGELRSLDLPETLETIGSDGFSYCEKVPDIFVPAGVKEIGHHAFFGCDGADVIHMACAENDPPVLGQDWVPKKRKLFMHDVPVLYGEERRGSR
ncbi:MAG: leucine-rich repeat domain-containing protein [Clostridia bacterium]|nr:leucine-rich repeat domain-containing protein [Clostridia bacterium]